ncbi:MAG TPA: ABC transporter permease [Bryobacteraceae bacterium]|nr:ABC transporter permease [Bryobacteraceae bacterium]
MPRPWFAGRAYRAVLRLLPVDFRSEFGDDMEQVFREQHDETWRDRGLPGLLRMWGATILDIVRMAPREHFSVLAHDIRYALRMMRKNPVYSLSAVLILGLAIGANTSIFSVVESVLLKPLPYADGNRLVILRQTAVKIGQDDIRFSAPEIADYRRRNRTLSELVEYHSMTFTLLSRDESHRVRTGVVSPAFFDMFGVKPLLGRAFRADDDTPGAPAVLLLSYEFWKSAERGDPAIVGKTYQMNDKVHTVVGVLPPIPQYPNENDIYMPSSACPFRARQTENREGRMMRVFGRLKPGVTLQQCHADLAAIAGRLEQDYPKAYPRTAGYGIASAGLRGELTARARPMLLLLMAAAAIVLLIACANVAKLILARMAQRERELVIRTAMGAGAARLLRQLLTESLILALLAAGVGMLCATGSLRLLTEFAGQLTPRAREIGIDFWVLLFAVFCAVATTVIFGSMSALYSRSRLAAGLKESGMQLAPPARRNWMRGALIAAQVAFSYVLLIGAGLMVRSFIQLRSVDPGFVPQRVLAVGFDLSWSKYGNDTEVASIIKRLLDKVQSQPGVGVAAIASSFPMDPDTFGMNDMGQSFRIEGAVLSGAEQPKVANLRTVTPGYFQTLGVPVVAGRLFRDSDNQTAPPVALVSRSLARKRWGAQDPIGRRVTFNDGKKWTTIVGVVGDVKEFGLAREAPEQLYMPLAQVGIVGSLLVRTAGDPATLPSQVRRAILAIDPQISITETKTLEEARSESIASPRTSADLFGLFAVLALIIAVAGIGSMLALSVRQRAREIGIRMALGATPGDIVRLVVRQGMLLVIIGLAVGLAGAVELTGSLKTLLFEVQPTDPATYTLVSAVLFGAALLAAYVPARRAARIDPQNALRSE